MGALPNPTRHAHSAPLTAKALGDSCDHRPMCMWRLSCMGVWSACGSSLPGVATAATVARQPDQGRGVEATVTGGLWLL